MKTKILLLALFVFTISTIDAFAYMLCEHSQPFLQHPTHTVNESYSDYYDLGQHPIVKISSDAYNNDPDCFSGAYAEFYNSAGQKVWSYGFLNFNENIKTQDWKAMPLAAGGKVRLYTRRESKGLPRDSMAWIRIDVMWN